MQSLHFLLKEKSTEKCSHESSFPGKWSGSVHPGKLPGSAGQDTVAKSFVSHHCPFPERQGVCGMWDGKGWKRSHMGDMERPSISGQELAFLPWSTAIFRGKLQTK